MAKKHRATASEEPLRTKMRKHLKALGLATREDYLAWCRDKGFATSLDKSQIELDEETQALKREEVRQERHLKIHRNPRKFIEQSCDGSLHPDDVTRPNWHEVCRSIHESKPDAAARDALQRLLLTVHDRADFLFESGTGRP